MLNLATLLEETARRHPDRVAVVFGDTRTTYRELDGAAARVAGGLVSMGVKPGDRVALSCPNLPWFPVVYYGILKAGAVVVPLNVLLKGREIGEHLRDCGAGVYVGFEGTDALPMGRFGTEGFAAAPHCRHRVVITADPTAPSPYEGASTLGALMAGASETFDTVATGADDTAVVLYTSGTTGVPKGAELTHSNMVLNARLADNQLFNLQEHDRYLVALPLFHSFGQTVLMNMGFYTGATLTLMARFDAGHALELMERDEITFFAGVPTMYWALLNHPALASFDLASIARTLTSTVSGGAAMPVELMRAFNERFAVKILEGYGLSETSPVATFNHFPRPVKAGTVGQPVWGTGVRVADPETGAPRGPGETGEILLKGHHVMKGYLGRPDETAAAMRGDWFRTGDVGQLDDDGYLTITDRVKDVVIRGGFNVYPREVEEVFMTHPAVSLVAVIGVPHDALGEEVEAYVILADGHAPAPDELVAWGREQLAAHKYPRRVEIVESLPMTATGKILKRELRARRAAEG